MSEDDARRDGDDPLADEPAEDGVADFLQELSEEDLAELSEGDDPGGDAGDGLELDDVQSVEIRNIFLTTLPQYLEPVEEMLGQLLATEPRDEGVRATLVKTLESIHTAAARIGIDDVSIRIDRMCDRLAQLGGGLRPDDELRDELDGELEALRQLSASAGGEAAAASDEGAGERARTIVAVLGRAQDIDRSVLEKLTSAGLVTVDQLRMAALDEVMAVTGLDEETVRHVMRAVDAGAGPRAPEPEPADAAGPAADPIEYPPGLEGDLARRLRERVEAEASIDELRARIRATRVEVQTMRDRLDAARDRVASRKTTLAAVERDTLEALSGLRVARDRRARLAAERDEAEIERNRAGADLERLRRERRSAEREQARFTDELAELRDRVQRLLSSVPSD